MSYGNAEFVPIVLGTSLNAYNIARCLHQAYGVRTLALGRAQPRETAHSQIIGVRAYPDFDQPQRIVEVLREVAAEFPGRKLLLLSTIEMYTNVLIEHRAQLEDLYIIPLVQAHIAQGLMNKGDFYATCKHLGVPHPETLTVGQEASSAADFGDQLPFAYPAIVKPSDTDLYPRLTFPGRKKVYLVHDGAQLRQVCAMMYRGGYVGDVIVQEYLAGDESVMRVVNTYSNAQGKMTFLSAAQIVLGVWDPTMIGNYNAVVTMHDEALTQSIRHLLDSVGYVGAANFDVMYSPETGESKLLELNVRQGAASFYCMAAADSSHNANLVANYVEEYVYGRPVEECVTRLERLWVNVPYPLVRWLAPPSVRPLVRQARRQGIWHTLKYTADSGWRRRLDVARISLRTASGYWTHRATRKQIAG